MIIQYGKQKNQPIQLLNINTFYRHVGTEITFVFVNGCSQVWKFKTELECSQVYTQIIRKESGLCLM